LAALKLAVGACANLLKVTSWGIVGLAELIVEQEECYKVFMVWFGRAYSRTRGVLQGIYGLV